MGREREELGVEPPETAAEKRDEEREYSIKKDAELKKSNDELNIYLFKLKLTMLRCHEMLKDSVRVEDRDREAAKLSETIDKIAKDLIESEYRGYTDIISAWMDMLKALKTFSAFLFTLVDGRVLNPLTAVLSLTGRTIESSGKKDPVSLQVKFNENGEMKLEAFFDGELLTPENLKAKYSQDKKWMGLGPSRINEIADLGENILKTGVKAWLFTQGYVEVDKKFIHRHTRTPLTQKEFESLNKPNDPSNLENFLMGRFKANIELAPSHEAEPPKASPAA